MSAVQKCLSITKELVAILKGADDTKREETISHIEVLITRREELLPEIRPPFSSQEEAAGKEMLELSKELTFFLEEVHNSILRDLNAIHLKKTSAARYNNPYTMVRNDGAFYDKRQ